MTPSLAHETGDLRPGIWLCDCDKCRAIAAASPATVLVVKGEKDRYTITAGDLPRLPRIMLSWHDRVREIWVRVDRRPSDKCVCSRPAGPHTIACANVSATEAGR
jgi:hypothetical protein